MLYHGATNVLNYTQSGAETPDCFAPAAAALLTSSGCSNPQGMEDSPLLSSEVLQRQTETLIFIVGVGESEIGA